MTSNLKWFDYKIIVRILLVECLNWHKLEGNHSDILRRNCGPGCGRWYTKKWAGLDLSTLARIQMLPSNTNWHTGPRYLRPHLHVTRVCGVGTLARSVVRGQFPLPGPTTLFFEQAVWHFRCVHAGTCTRGSLDSNILSCCGSRWVQQGSLSLTGLVIYFIIVFPD
jgi:hypothetical protein